MAELPFHLKTIESLPGALDILRLLGEYEDFTADADDICDTLELSDRRFSKAIRRLVTKGYVVMDGDMVYRLTDQGETAIDELVAYDEAEGHEPVAKPASSGSASSNGATAVDRRLVLALPRTLTANQPANVVVGFNPNTSGESLSEDTDMLLRLSVVNGEPTTPMDVPLTLTDDAVHESFEITPGAFTQVRLRLEVMHMDNYSGDISSVGGMYVDVDVTNRDAQDTLTAYGTNITVPA